MNIRILCIKNYENLLELLYVIEYLVDILDT